MGAIKNYTKIFYKKTSIPAKKLFFSNFSILITSNIILLVIFANLLLFTSCKDEIIQPAPKPPGSQEYIPWPSLADSPWPMNHHDPQSTGRSQYIGPALGMIKNTIPTTYLQTGISIGPDSTFYTVPLIDGLHAYSPDGNLKWNYVLHAQNFLTPLITCDNIIIVSDPTDSGAVIKAINSNGEIKWDLKLDGAINGSMINIDLDGDIFTVDDTHTLYKINKEGQLIWKLTDNKINPGGTGISFSPDGKTLYLPGTDPSILAIDIINKKVKWTFGDKILFSAPLIDSDGYIYFIPADHILGNFQSALYSINPDGTVRWSYDFKFDAGLYFGYKPTIDKEGNIYFYTDTLYSINYNGKLNWNRFLTYGGDGPLVCDVNGNIYLGLETGTTIEIKCYSNKGYLKWELQNLSSEQNGNCPAINNDGTLYYPPWRGNKIFIIK